MKAGIYTVPHTGTHFAMRYLQLFGLHPEAISAPSNYVHRHAGYEKHDWDEFSKLKCIVMARDPYLCGIRFLYNKQSIEDCAKCWNDFLDSYKDLDHFVLDLGINEEDRLEHLCQVADFIGIWPNKYQKEIKAYADAWLPVKGTDSDMKKHYTETGILPTNYNWKLLDRAVFWYRSLPTNDK